MSQILKKTVAIFCLILSSFTYAQQQQIEIKSAVFDKTIKFNLHLPQSYGSGAKHYPLLFDPNPATHTAWAGLNHWLSHNGNNPWPETIVITPQQYEKDLLPESFQGENKEQAQKLLIFFEQELLKTIETRYRTNGFRIYSEFYNWFGLYTLLVKPELFNAVISASPRLADNGQELVLLAKEKLASLAGLDRFLFLSIGKSNLEKVHVNEFNNFIATLKSYSPKTLSWHQRRYNNLSYMSQPVAAMTEATELIFK